MGKKNGDLLTGISVMKVGYLKPANSGKKHGRGYIGIMYRNVKTGGVRSIEWHTPHRTHGFHIQYNY
jgi:hypothetical protein